MEPALTVVPSSRRRVVLASRNALPAFGFAGEKVAARVFSVGFRSRSNVQLPVSGAPSLAVELDSRALRTKNVNATVFPRSLRLIVTVMLLLAAVSVGAVTRTNAVPFHCTSSAFVPSTTIAYSNPLYPVAAFLSTLSRMTTKSSAVNVGRFGIVMANVTLPSKSFDTTTWEMSAAPPMASPCASVKVAVAAPAPPAPSTSAATIAARSTVRLPKGPLLRSRTRRG